MVDGFRTASMLIAPPRDVCHDSHRDVRHDVRHGGRRTPGGAGAALLAAGLWLLTLAGAHSAGDDKAAGSGSVADASTLRADNYRDVVARVLRWYTGIDYAAELFAIPGPPSEARRIYAGVTLRDEALHTLDEYLCDEGGWAHFDLSNDSSVADTVILDGCPLAGDTRSGTMSWQDALFGPPPLGRRHTFDDYRIDTDAGRAIAASGSVWRNRAGSPLATSLADEYRLERYRSADDDGETLLEDVDTRIAWAVASVAPERELVALRGRFRMRSSVADGATLQVTTPVPFERADGASTFTQGLLSIAAGDGSALRLETDAEAPGSLRVTLSVDGVETLLEDSWDTWTTSLESP